MAPAGEQDDESTPTPDEAFAVLGNEIRMETLRVLADADGASPFSVLYDAVDVDDSGQFNHHLDELVGHYVCKTDAGYELTQAGNRVIEAVLSGAMTDAPVVEPTEIDQSCPYCDAPVEVSFREERVRLFCTSCAGTFARSYSESESASAAPPEYGHIGDVILPPSGVRDRTPAEMTDTAITWANLEFAAAASGICPRCAAPFEQSPEVCEPHDVEDGLCEDCGRRYAVQIRNRCTNCTFGYGGTLLAILLDEPVFLEHLLEHGVNPISPSPERFLALDMTYEETVHAVDPFEARFSVAVDDDALAVTVDEDLDVVDVERDDGGADD
jgi:hypothetical protein